VDHPLARFAIALFNLPSELVLLLRRQKGKAPDLSQVCVKSGIALIHARSLFAEASPPLLRKSGILRCRSRGDSSSLFRGVYSLGGLSSFQIIPGFSVANMSP